VDNVQHIDGDKQNNAWDNLRDRSTPQAAAVVPTCVFTGLTIATNASSSKTTASIGCRDRSALLIRSGQGLQVLRVYHLPTECEASNFYSQMASSVGNCNAANFVLSKRGSRVEVTREREFSDERLAREAFLV